jgi:hypothetical protein
MASKPKVVFSFSLWGTNPKYTEGMIQNAKNIGVNFPDAYVYIYITDDVPTDIKEQLALFPNVCMLSSPKQEGSLNLFDRFLAIDDCDIMFVRDTDSRIHDRDISCIGDFLSSNKTLHIIRDHKCHQNRIMGGMWGLRKMRNKPSMKTLIDQWKLRNKRITSYGCDQIFLSMTIYNMCINSRLVHDRFALYIEESTDRVPFSVPIENNLFVGQVFIYKEGQETQEFIA